MRKETYHALMEALRARPRLLAFLAGFNRLLTLAVFLSYPLLLASLAFFPGGRWKALAGAVLVPGVFFVLLTLVRKKLNRKRPYEVFGEPSAMYKDKEGQSFPSRHVFSAFVIAMAWLILSDLPVLGRVLLGAGVILALLRVLLGVHFLSDVLAGALAGVLSGLLCLFFV